VGRCDGGEGRASCRVSARPRCFGDPRAVEGVMGEAGTLTQARSPPPRLQSLRRDRQKQKDGASTVHGRSGPRRRRRGRLTTPDHGDDCVNTGSASSHQNKRLRAGARVNGLLTSAVPSPFQPRRPSSPRHCRASRTHARPLLLSPSVPLASPAAHRPSAMAPGEMDAGGPATSSHMMKTTKRGRPHLKVSRRRRSRPVLHFLTCVLSYRTRSICSPP
jgi:hypothetical protein